MDKTTLLKIFSWFLDINLRDKVEPIRVNFGVLIQQQKNHSLKIRFIKFHPRPITGCFGQQKIITCHTESPFLSLLMTKMGFKMFTVNRSLFCIGLYILLNSKGKTLI